MKIVIAPQAFKGSLSALEAARAMGEGVRRGLSDAQTVLVPVADGGDGTLQTLMDSSGGRILEQEVTGPLGEAVSARWGIMGDGDTAVIEMAQAAGLALVPPEKRNPLFATTYGVGELIRHTLDRGLRRFIVGVGGSATVDGGAGAAQALGVRLLDDRNEELPFGGAALARLARIDFSELEPRVRGSRLLVACDVSNPLIGPSGASAVYGPQKGATPEMVAELEGALAHYAQVIQRGLGIDVRDVLGAGAAGGLAAGLMALLGAELKPGVDIVLDVVGLDRHLETANLVITGEGRLDRQTVFNKAPVGVARRAKARGIPVIAVAGSLGEGYEETYAHGIDVAVAISSPPITLEEAMRDAPRLIAIATEKALRLVEVSPSP